ncbi:Myb/SANT-like DNA-binding domain-containing protein [Plectosphaerella plurivora]|uniref:Myb/SANT-like DNA-binding domain-containing protein n=1 Tax=Plectosphaerella plurivora TaxID=936078 RepID=A0A9P8V3D5_9PEZI|nr:Myb/SANT-like DNA-binding domain-containing protein [Plectosphaerella plurivora]
MSDDEYPIDGASTLTASGSTERDKRAPRFSWTPAYEATFFRSLCESVHRGLRENHSFKGEAWDHAATALREKHGAFPTKSHLVNKSDNARKKFRLWRGLREDPDFLYNPSTKVVTASDASWKAHIEKEPLSRALRGRPFEHEEFMEILYPDVIGSGGAPKRIMKPKRKGPDVIQSDDPEMPGTGVMDLQVDTPYRPPSQAGMVQPQVQQQIPQQLPQQVQQQRQSFSSPATVQARQMSMQQQQRPTSTAIPPRTHIAGTSALTPPEETAIHGRRRFVAGQAGHTQAAADKAPTAAMGPPATHGTVQQQPAEKRRRISSYSQNNAAAAESASGGSSSVQVASTPVAAAGDSSIGVSKQVVEDSIVMIADALRGRVPACWPEQAIEIFFRDFHDEDMDLQLKIAEKALADETKAMIFCKMSTTLRKHWVKRLRELHNRNN